MRSFFFLLRLIYYDENGIMEIFPFFSWFYTTRTTCNSDGNLYSNCVHGDFPIKKTSTQFNSVLDGNSGEYGYAFKHHHSRQMLDERTLFLFHSLFACFNFVTAFFNINAIWINLFDEDCFSIRKWRSSFPSVGMRFWLRPRWKQQNSKKRRWIAIAIVSLLHRRAENRLK